MMNKENLLLGLPSSKIATQEGEAREQTRPLRVDVAGGGPVALTFALALTAYLGQRAQIRIFDHRWHREYTNVCWQSSQQGNHRRQQIVTIQSMVWSNLPLEVQERLFDDSDFTEMWPYGPDSPEERGRPRNLPISHIEDRLLELLQTKDGVTLIPQRYEPRFALSRNVLAICEGAHSQTREHFISQFGHPYPNMYQLDGKPLEETIVGMQVETGLPDSMGVLLTAAQNRYLLNIRHGRGFLNMRLTNEEAAELVGLGAIGPIDCLQGRPCVMLRHQGTYRCPTHETLFKPSVDATSYLWPRMKDGLRLFGIDEEHLLAIMAFRFSLLHRPRFFAELGDDCWGFLLGDAANAIHFWPGRGLNTGLKSALGLARCLALRWRGSRLRAGDLCEFEGLMQMLQCREVDNRAWRTMLMRDEKGDPCPIHTRITRGLHGSCDRLTLTDMLMHRLRTLRARLTGRMGKLPTDQELEARLSSVSKRTLKVLVETGPWIASEVGGPEVDVNALLPTPSELIPKSSDPEGSPRSRLPA